MCQFLTLHNSLDFLALQKGEKTANRVMFFLSADKLYSLEPEPAPAALDTAQSRMQRDGRTNDAADSFSVVLQTLADAADDLLDAMSDDVSDGLVQSNAVLENLDVKGRDFGVTDVVSTQIVLGDIEELLSRCAESLIGMGLAARQAASRIKTDDVFLAGRYKTLVSDIEAVADDADFLHERVRFLQTINGLALNVKQNQIIKVFTVITAVFLPALLVSTYYSMNLEFLPVLEWKYVEPATLIFTAVLAIVPLIYVKQRGWLR